MIIKNVFEVLVGGKSSIDHSLIRRGTRRRYITSFKNVKTMIIRRGIGSNERERNFFDFSLSNGDLPLFSLTWSYNHCFDCSKSNVIISKLFYSHLYFFAAF